MGSSLRYSENPTRRGKQKGAVSKSVLDAQRNRRDFLKSMLTVAGGTAGLWAASKLGGKRSEKEVHSQAGLKIEPVIEKKQEFSASHGSNFLEIAFPGLDEGEKEAARENILLARANVKGILDSNSYENLRALEDSIKLAARNAGMPNDVGELFLGLVAAESGGRRDALSPKGFAGLTQMGVDVAGRQNLKPEDRFVPSIVLPVSVKDLREQNDLRYDNWPLALWAWHMGPAGMYTILNVYFHDQFGDPEHAIEGATYERGLEVINYFKQRIKERNVNVHKVLQNKAVQKILANKEDWNYTDEYVYRIVAGAELYADYKSLRSQTGNG